MIHFLADIEKENLLQALYEGCNTYTKKGLWLFFVESGMGSKSMFEKKISAPRPYHFSMEELDKLLAALIANLDPMTTRTQFARLFGTAPEEYGYVLPTTEQPMLSRPFATTPDEPLPVTTTKSAIAEYEPKFEGTRNLQRKMAEVKASSW